MNGKRSVYGWAAILLVAPAAWFIQTSLTQEDRLVQPRYGPFRLTVETTGELRAKHAGPIYGPTRAHGASISRLTIQQLLPEGTYVKKGDVVAELERSAIHSSIQDARHRLEQDERYYSQTQLDTALTLSKFRDELVALRYTQEAALLYKKEAIYEPLATQRRAAFRLERAERAYNQALHHYHILVQQAQTQMRQAQASRRRSREFYQELLRLEQEFTVVAPNDGLLIYLRDRRGRPLTTGSTLSSWNPIIATLPDLSIMESVTYVNEVDVLKVRAGQPVEIRLEAASGRLFDGTVARVANMGEQRPNSDAKLFEVIIEIIPPDNTLRPSMTTGNTIVIAKVTEALQIPAACLYTNETLSYVLVKKRSRIYRQEVKLGLSNEDEIIVKAGLDTGDRLYLSLPADTTGIILDRLTMEDALATKGNE